MISEEDMVDSELMLHAADYPRNFVNKMHPDDGRIFTSPISPETIFHKRIHHNRLLLRICIKIAKNKYIPFTFVCDTGAPQYLYLSERVREAISPRIITDDINEFIMYNGKRITIAGTPSNHDDCNIMGLMMLDILGLKVCAGNFEFEYIPSYI